MIAAGKVDPLTGIEAARFGVYIHFPYCLRKCPYCDFAVAVAKRIPTEEYAEAVVQELRLRLEAEPKLSGRTIDSIYFGGGTPSLWGAAGIERVTQALGRAFSLDSTIEVTLEANPETLDAQSYHALREAGINRLSIGAQSFHPHVLGRLGRAHDQETICAAFDEARRAGFDNLSLDLIYGVPGQSVEEARRDAEAAAQLDPEHLSAYSLTIEEELLAEPVPLAKAVASGELTPPSEEEWTQMAEEIRRVYDAAGLVRYEISNHAKPGLHSRHNALYWTGGECLGLGVGAVGLIHQGESSRRSFNHRTPAAYFRSVQKGELPAASDETLSPAERFEERVALGLRLADGIDLEAACQIYGQSWPDRRRRLGALIERGWVRHLPPRWSLTPDGTWVHSEVAASLI